MFDVTTAPASFRASVIVSRLPSAMIASFKTFVEMARSIPSAVRRISDRTNPRDDPADMASEGIIPETTFETIKGCVISQMTTRKTPGKIAFKAVFAP
jgi:hypothetical protein